MTGPLISLKELAAQLNRSHPYVAAMVRQGFPAKCGRTTLAAALDWLEKHPHPMHRNGARRYVFKTQQTKTN